MVRYMRTLEFYYPHLVQLLQIGTTHEGRSIEGVKIGIDINPSPSDFEQDHNEFLNKTQKRQKRAFWIDGNMHAREWASSHTALFIINQLIASYGKDTFLTKALEQIDFYIVPCANPDGFEFSRSSINPKVFRKNFSHLKNHFSIRLWRKNRSPEQCTRTWNGLLCCRGVDLNRNFDFHWAETGSSLNACSNLYSGKRAFSEPESRALAEFLKNNNEEEGERVFYAFMTLHTYAQMWIHPFSHEYHTYPSDADDLKNVALRATERLEQIYGTHYRIGTGADLLAPASGGSDDWAKETLGIKYVYLVELRPKLELSNGFILNQDELIPTAIETFEAIKEVIRAVMSEPNESFEVKNTTETSIGLTNQTLKLDENEEGKIDSTGFTNDLKQYTEKNNSTVEMFESTLLETSSLGMTENQTETITTPLTTMESVKESEQYTQHTTESFDFLIGIGEEKANVSSFSLSPQFLFPLFTIPKIQTIPIGSGFGDEQKREEPDLLTTSFSTSTNSLPSTDQIENIETTETTSSENIEATSSSSTESSSTQTSSSTPQTSSSSPQTSSSIITDETSSSEIVINLEEDPTSTTTISNSTTTSSSSELSTSISTTLSEMSEITTSRSSSKIKTTTNRTTVSSSTPTSSSSTSRTTPTSATLPIPPIPIPKQYTPIKFVAFDEEKIELKPLNDLKKYQNSRSSTNSVNFPIFDNDVELAIENDKESGEDGKMTTREKEEPDKLLEQETERNEKLKQYNNTQTGKTAETVLETTSTRNSETTVPSASEMGNNTTAKLPHLWMKTQKIFTLPWVQTRRLSLAKLLRIQKIPTLTTTPLNTSTTTTTPTSTKLPYNITPTTKLATMLFTAVDQVEEKNELEFTISPPQLISPPIHPKLYLAPKFLSSAFSSSNEENFCCLHKIGNNGQIKGIPLKGPSAINLLKSALLEQTTTKIPLITTTEMLTTNSNNDDEIVQIMPKKCSDKKSSCAFWIRAHSPVCAEQHHFMERNCAFSCGFCS
uniref:ShKT domain-containing protein n=1 Tax=Meloidogyne incognita TaxID=6306 RepID=A0A914LF23_MELIC